MNADKLVKNMVKQHQKPFSAQIVADMCGLEVSKVTPVIKKLLAAGELLSVGRGLYTKQRDICYSNGRFSFSRSMAKRVYEVISKHEISNCRQVGELLGVSHESAAKYLNSLATIGSIRRDKKRYYTIKEDFNGLGRLNSGLLERQRYGKSE